MKKLLCVAVVAAMCAVPAMAQTNLNLRIVTDADASTIGVGASTSVNVFIKGELTGDPSEGLALWSTNLTNTGNKSVDLCDRNNVMLLDAPAGDMQYFKRNLGLTNPDDGGFPGYTGTCDGAMGLWQIGGGLNTIHNTGPTLYPIGDPIPTGVADGAETILAEGTLTTPADFTAGDSIVLTLGSEFANVITAGEIGPVYAVEEATTALVGSTLTINAGGAPPVVTDAWSFGYHGGTVNADLGIPLVVGGTATEGRVIDDVSANRVYLVVTLDQNMAAGAQSVATNPAISGVTATGDGSADIVVAFPTAAPGDETCYNVDLAGSTSTGGGVEAAGTDFCVCYNEADVDGSGTVNSGDKNLVVSALNFFLDANAAANLTADIDRSGTVNSGDKNLVTSTLNYFHSPAACP